jgi:hypothetical protein
MSWGHGRKAAFVIIDDPLKDSLPVCGDPDKWNPYATTAHPEPFLGTVYLICFDRPFHHARHYLGYTENIIGRLERHQSGHGSKLLRAVNEAGIKYGIVRIWEGVDRHFERKLHKRGGNKKLCPICNPKTFATNGRNHEDKV